MAAQSGKKKILIALQKPTVVLGNADPLDTINRYLSRSYAIGPVRGRWIAGGIAASIAAGYALYAGFNAMFGTQNAKTRTLFDSLRLLTDLFSPSFPFAPNSRYP